MALELLIKKEVPASVALAKAKKVLQMQKDLSEKLKKFPWAPASSTSDGSPQLKLPAPAAASLKPPASTVAALPEITTIPNYEAVKCAQELLPRWDFTRNQIFLLS
ncbi:hypothetical protein L1049_017893 [Liquidambar formosana]|uniref:Uncharacterized protein n=1 Tax=Liquidambar formosana TaxID=63359 RepID=A0AAP0NJK2_LIQFO